MDNSYEILRKNYRDIIQSILDCIDTLSLSNSCEIKKNISNVYRSKNIKKSIDTELKDYILNLNTENKIISLSDNYWKEYNFTNTFYNETDIQDTLNEFYQSALKYFCLLEVPQENEKSTYENNKTNIFGGDFFSVMENIIKNLPDQENHNEDVNENEDCFNQNAPFPFPEEIVKLAQELSSEINIPESFYDQDNAEMGKNPKKIFEKLTSSDGQSVLMNMMEKVSSKLNQKINNGEIDPNKMQSSAQECLEKIMKNSEFENILKNFSPQNMESMFNANSANLNNLNTEKSNETKKRLQKKLKKKHIIDGKC